MLYNIKPEDIMFLDIETVPVSPSFDDLDPVMQAMWDKKSSNFRNETQSAGTVYQRAGIYAEFGKIICISVGVLKDRNPYGFRLKSFFGEDEKAILTEFSGMLVRFAKNKEVLLVRIMGKNLIIPTLRDV